jgi:hypothetical protein
LFVLEQNRTMLSAVRRRPEFCRSSGGFLPAGAGAAVLSSQLRLENQNDLYYVCDLIAGKYVIL